MTMIEMYLPQIIDFLEDQEPPAKVCHQLNLCKNSTVDTTVQSSVQQDSNFGPAPTPTCTSGYCCGPLQIPYDKDYTQVGYLIL